MVFVTWLIIVCNKHIIEWEKQRKSVLVAAIGDITAKALKKYGIIADIVPSQYDSVSLIDSMEDYYR